MIDCSNIYNFVNEWERRRKAEPEQRWGSITNYFLGLKQLHTLVEELQKWSDEHQKMTRKEKFIKMCKENRFENVNLCLNENVPSVNCRGNNCIDCIEYWNEEVSE